MRRPTQPDEPIVLPGQLPLSLLLDDAPPLESTVTLEEARQLRRRPTRRRLLSAVREEALSDFFTRLPEPGETLHVVSNGRFDYWQFVPVSLALLACPAEALYGSTWTMNRGNVLELLALLDSGRIGRASVLTGTYFKRRETAVATTLTEGLLTRGQRYRAFANHAKVILLAAPPDFLTFEGSANWTANPRLEQTTVTNDRDLYQFHRAWFEEILS